MTKKITGTIVKIHTNNVIRGTSVLDFSIKPTHTEAIDDEKLIRITLWGAMAQKNIHIVELGKNVTVEYAEYGILLRLVANIT